MPDEVFKQRSLLLAGAFGVLLIMAVVSRLAITIWVRRDMRRRGEVELPWPLGTWFAGAYSLAFYLAVRDQQRRAVGPAVLRHVAWIYPILGVLPGVAAALVVWFLSGERSDPFTIFHAKRVVLGIVFSIGLFAFPSLWLVPCAPLLWTQTSPATLWAILGGACALPTLWALAASQILATHHRGGLAGTTIGAGAIGGRRPLGAILTAMALWLIPLLALAAAAQAILQSLPN
jgi:hypothetical protein